ncbi:MAG: hypothetical protein RLZZ628_1892 [Bacteroidota bacterium]|jgi:hypothetical protein
MIAFFIGAVADIRNSFFYGTLELGLNGIFLGLNNIDL